MKISYDYEDFIEEIKSDVEEGLLSEDGEMYILRSDKPITYGDITYYPIIDYYYLSDGENHQIEEYYIKEEYSNAEWNDMVSEWEKAEKQFQEDFPKLRIERVSDVLEEMIEVNRII